MRHTSTICSGIIPAHATAHDNIPMNHWDMQIIPPEAIRPIHLLVSQVWHDVDATTLILADVRYCSSNYHGRRGEGGQFSQQQQQWHYCQLQSRALLCTLHQNWRTLGGGEQRWPCHKHLRKSQSIGEAGIEHPPVMRYAPREGGAGRAEMGQQQQWWQQQPPPHDDWWQEFAASRINKDYAVLQEICIYGTTFPRHMRLLLPSSIESDGGDVRLQICGLHEH